MREIKGDLIKLFLSGEFDVIVHGCNCFCAMGNGIAKQIKAELPEAYDADLKTLKGDKNKLGTYTLASVSTNTHTGFVVNAYTQYDYWTSGVKVDYNAVKSVFSLIKKDFPNKRIGYPLIGAGLAGGDWEVISKIIDTELLGMDHTLVRLP